METLRGELSKQTQRDYDRATIYHDGKWLLITVDDDRVVDDLKRLLGVKRTPKARNKNG